MLSGIPSSVMKMDYEKKEMLNSMGYRIHTDGTLLKMKKESLVAMIHDLEEKWAMSESYYRNAMRFNEDLIKKARENEEKYKDHQD